MELMSYNHSTQLKIVGEGFFFILFLLLEWDFRKKKNMPESLLLLLKEYDFLIVGAPPKWVQLCLMVAQCIFLLILDGAWSRKDSPDHYNIILWAWLHMLGLEIYLSWCTAHAAKPGRVILKLVQHNSSVVLKVTFLTIFITCLSVSCDVSLFLFWETQNICKFYSHG